MLISYKKPKGRFFIVGKPGGSPAVMRHISINLNNDFGTLYIDGNAVTLDANNTWEADIADGTQITMRMTTDSDHEVCCWYDPNGVIPEWQGNYGWCYANPATITVSGDYAISAQINTYYNLTVVADPTKYTLKVNDTVYNTDYHGRKLGGNCDQLVCIPETGYQFNGWGTTTVDGDGWWCYRSDEVITPDVTAAGQQPDNELWYTTSDRNPVDLTNANFNTSVTNHTYTDKGVIKFSGNLTEIGDNSFENANIETVSFPSTLRIIGNSAFDSCPINSLDLKNVESIGMEAFDYNYITNLHIPASVTYMNANPFRTPYGNATITVDANNPVFSDGGGNNCVYHKVNKALVVGGPNSVVPDGCEVIGSFSFSNCSTIASIEFPASVTEIEMYAFGSDMQGVLNSITAHSVPVFGGSAFMSVADNGVLTLDYGLDPTDWVNVLPSGWTVVQPQPAQPNDEIWYTSSNGQVVTPYKNKFGTGITVTYNTYADGKGIIKLSGNATTIGNLAFNSCSGLTSVTIPNSVISIGDSAFNRCSGLTSANIPSNVTSIGKTAFNSCSGLTSVTIPNSVTSIGDSAFLACTGLTSITCERTTPPTLGNNSVFNNTNNCPIYVPAASVAAYKSWTNWENYSSRIQAIP